MTTPRILIIDDDTFVLKTTSDVMRLQGYDVTTVDDGLKGLAMAQDPSFDVALIDVKMPNISGLEVLKAVKDSGAGLVVIMMSAVANIATAVEAVKLGAYDYLPKPFPTFDELTIKVRNAVDRRMLMRRTDELERALQTSAKLSFEEFVGDSAPMKAVYRLIAQIAPSPSTVLIQGESGTGKELVARSLHERSLRKGKPFVTVNCSAMTETLLESELFGYVKGAFTGAASNL